MSEYSLAPLLWHNRVSKTVTDCNLHRLGISLYILYILVHFNVYKKTKHQNKANIDSFDQ